MHGYDFTHVGSLHLSYALLLFESQLRILCGMQHGVRYRSANLLVKNGSKGRGVHHLMTS
jgi:hypothetical protein